MMSKITMIIAMLVFAIPIATSYSADSADTVASTPIVERTAAGNKTISESTADDINYYKTLKSMLSSRSKRPKPHSATRDINLIELSKGAGGVLFGQSIDDVIKVWGKPTSIFMSYGPVSSRFWFGGSHFEFRNNKLEVISIHSIDLPEARFSNGTGFKSTVEDIKKAFGEPSKIEGNILIYDNVEGSALRFQFMVELAGGTELISIQLRRTQ